MKVRQWEGASGDDRERTVIGISVELGDRVEFDETSAPEVQTSLSFSVDALSAPACDEPITITVERLEDEPGGQLFVQPVVSFGGPIELWGDPGISFVVEDPGDAS